MKRKTFVMYEDWGNYIINLPKELAGELSQMIMRYAFYDETKEAENPAIQAMFEIIKPVIEENAEKYKNKCDKLKSNFKCTPNGHQKGNKRDTDDAEKDYVASSTSSSTSDEMKEKINEVIDYLNVVCDKNYKAKSKSSVEYISGRLNDGFTVDDLKQVIDTKASKWKGDPKMDDFLRPNTLFAPKKFEDYLNERPREKAQTRAEEVDSWGIEDDS